jgi:hypothetical protein
MNAHTDHIAKGNARELLDSILFFLALFLFVSTIGIIFYVAV